MNENIGAAIGLFLVALVMATLWLAACESEPEAVPLTVGEAWYSTPRPEAPSVVPDTGGRP